jgi:hypothetical protein
MATLYSDNFAGSSATVLDDQAVSPAGAGHGRIRYKRMEVTLTAAGYTTGDTIRLGSFKSNDRILEIYASNGAFGAAGLADLGLYLSGTAHDGAVVDADCFADGEDVAAAGTRDEMFLGANTSFDDQDRGKEIWKLLDDASLTTYGSDPQTQMDLVWTVVNDGTQPAIQLVVEVYFTSGD